jgi:hypothetical protein
LENFPLFFWIWFSMPSACSSSPFMPVIHRLSLLMVFQRSFMFNLYVPVTFTYVYLNVLIHLPVFKSWYSVFNLIQSIKETFFEFLNLIYWAFHFQNFNLISSGFLYFYWNPLSYSALSSLLHSAIYLYFLWICSGIYLCSLILLNILTIITLNSLSEIPSISLSLDIIILKCLTFRGIMLHCFFIFLVFLHWHFYIWGQVIGW